MVADDQEFLARSILRGAVFRLTSLLAARGFTVVRLLVFARLFAPHTIGAAALALACVTVISSAADFGFLQSVLRTKNRDARLVDTAFTMSVIASICVAGAIFAAAPYVAPLFGTGIAPHVRFLALLAFSIPFTFPTVLWERDLAFGHPAAATALNELTILVAAVAAEIAFNLGVWSILIGYAAGPLVSAAYLWILVPARPRFRIDRAQAKSVMSFGWPYMLQGANGQVMARGDNLLVGKFAGATNLAYYNLAWNLPTMIGALAAAIETMLVPVYARYEDDRQGLVRLFNLTTKLWSVVGSFFGFAVIIFRHDLVTALYGPRWRPVAPILELMTISFVIRFCTGYAYDNLVILRGRTRYMMKWGFVNTALVFTVGLAMISRFGPIGGAWFWIIQAVVLIPLVRLPIIRSELKTTEFWRHAWQPVAAGLVAAAIASVLLGVSLPSGTAIALTAYVLVYLAALTVIDRQLIRDIGAFRAVARGRY